MLSMMENRLDRRARTLTNHIGLRGRTLVQVGACGIHQGQGAALPTKGRIYVCNRHLPIAQPHTVANAGRTIYVVARPRPLWSPVPDPCGRPSPTLVVARPRPLWSPVPDPCGRPSPTLVVARPRPLWSPVPDPCGRPSPKSRNLVVNAQFRAKRNCNATAGRAGTVGRAGTGQARPLHGLASLHDDPVHHPLFAVVGNRVVHHGAVIP